MLQHADDVRWHLDMPEAIDPLKPGILERRIEGIGSYIVRATSMSRSVAQYEESVWRPGQGLSHRVGAYREIHRRLRQAADEGRRVTVVWLENCAAADLAARKRHWVARRGTLNTAA